MAGGVGGKRLALVVDVWLVGERVVHVFYGAPEIRPALKTKATGTPQFSPPMARPKLDPP